uniref:Uncharacterized protein n=1 Tax=Bionectria ochroleuca TaxID=29856 RepID=A0A8H7KBB0_BIOOC
MSSFIQVKPAFYLKANVKTDILMGANSTGATLAHGRLVSGRLTSERGFETELSGSVIDGDDYITMQPDGKILRPQLIAHVRPDDGDTPFQLTSTGVSEATPDIIAITTTETTTGKSIPYGETYSVWRVEFQGGSARIANLRNSIFVASVTVSDGEHPDEFVVGFKISKVYNTKTDVVIGQEFRQD